MADDGAAPLPSTAGRGDRLTALDDDLLHKIITRLPVTEAVRTAALATRWRHLWSSTPLVLYDGDHVGLGPARERDALVARVLREHPGHFRSVRLTDCRLDSLDRELPGWPRLLAAKNTQRLDLVNGFIPNGATTLPRFPADVLRCASLEELLLAYWVYPRGADIFLPNLRRLSLLMVVIREQDLERLVTACPDLDTLTLNGGRPRNVRLRSRSLRCALVALSRVENFTVVDAPLLERLVLFSPPRNGVTMVKIGYYAAGLRVLGRLDTRAHRLQIGDIVIEPNTMASASTVIPSVNILAVTVNFGVLREVEMLTSFLRCFPNIDTLHIESTLHDPSTANEPSGKHHPSVTANEPSGEHNAIVRFWQEVGLVECLRSHVKKMVIHKFRGDENEFEFLKFIAMNSQELQSLHVVLQRETIPSPDKVSETEDELQSLQFRTGISGVLLVLPTVGFRSSVWKATDLTSDDPFYC